MRTRKNAPFYETALIMAMLEGNEKEAVTIINNIQSYAGNNSPSLLYIDANGINFLTYALHLKLRQVVKTLIDTDVFIESQEILLGKNQSGQTLICQAAKLGYHEAVKSFVSCINNLISKLSEDEKINYHQFQFWFSADDEGNTPLHYAAKNRNSHLYLFILQLIENEPNKNKLINAKNKYGDTALHLAINEEGVLHIELIDSLLTAGAEIHRANNRFQSCFAKLLKQSIERQVNCIHLLSDENKKYILKNYEVYLEGFPNDKNAKQAYFRYKGLHESLQNLIVANLEYNIEVEPRDWFIQTTRSQHQYKLKVMYETMPEKIAPEILYLYFKDDSINYALRDPAGHVHHQALTSHKLHSIKTTLQHPPAELESEQIKMLTTIFNNKCNIILLTNDMPFKTHQEKYSIDNVENLEFSKKLPLYAARLSQGIFGAHHDVIQRLLKEKQLLANDEALFKQLSQTIEQRIQDWTDRKPNSFRYKLAGAAIPTVTWSALFAGVGYCIYLIVQPRPEVYWSWFVDDPHNVYPYNHTQFINGSHYDCLNNGTAYLHNGYNLTKLCDNCCFKEEDVFSVVPSSLIGSMAAGLGSMVNLGATYFSYVKLWKYTPAIIIYDNEWVDLIQLIQKNIIQPFHLLTQDKLPTDRKKIADLTQEINSLRSSHTQDDIIASFGSIRTHIQQIYHDMKYSQKPFSQLDNDKSKESSDESDDELTERVGLLGRGL